MPKDIHGPRPMSRAFTRRMMALAAEREAHRIKAEDWDKTGHDIADRYPETLKKMADGPGGQNGL